MIATEEFDFGLNATEEFGFSAGDARQLAKRAKWVQVCVPTNARNTAAASLFLSRTAFLKSINLCSDADRLPARLYCSGPPPQTTFLAVGDVLSLDFADAMRALMSKISRP